MLKLAIFVVIIVIGFIAYTGIDVTSEYEDFSEIRNMVFESLIDPIVKKVLTFATESNFDEVIDESISRYEDKS